MLSSRLSKLILTFSVLNFIVLISPAFLKAQFPLMPLLRVGDVTDILTPIILLPCYWLMFEIKEKGSVMRLEAIVFLVFAALLAQGQGMHLSANSIDNLIGMPNSTDVYSLVHFFDEGLAHYIWFIGTIGLTGLIIARQKRIPSDEVSTVIPEIIAAFVYGFTYFITVIEAQVSPLGIPFAILVVIFGIFFDKKDLKKHHLIIFYLAAYVVSLLLFTAWYLYWGGLPEFSKIGLI